MPPFSPRALQQGLRIARQAGTADVQGKDEQPGGREAAGVLGEEAARLFDGEGGSSDADLQGQSAGRTLANWDTEEWLDHWAACEPGDQLVRARSARPAVLAPVERKAPEQHAATAPPANQGNLRLQPDQRQGKLLHPKPAPPIPRPRHGLAHPRVPLALHPARA